MDKDVACVCNQILFNHRKEGNTAICDNIDDPWQHCAQWNKSAEKDKQLWYYLSVESNEAKLLITEVEWWLPGAGGRGAGENV